jgi:hypothetical protein
MGGNWNTQRKTTTFDRSLAHSNNPTPILQREAQFYII